MIKFLTAANPLNGFFFFYNHLLHGYMGSVIHLIAELRSSYALEK